MELCCLHLGKFLFNRKNGDGRGLVWKFVSSAFVLLVFLCFVMFPIGNGVLTEPVLLVYTLNINACVHS